MLSVKASTFCWKMFLILSDFFKNKVLPCSVHDTSADGSHVVNDARKKILKVQGITLLSKTSEVFYIFIKNIACILIHI